MPHETHVLDSGAVHHPEGGQKIGNKVSVSELEMFETDTE